MDKPLLRVEDIKKELTSKENTFLLDSITFDLYPGEIAALVGLNGAGKTTLMKIITGLLEQDSGNMLFAGKPGGFSGNKIGYLPENFSSCRYDLKVMPFMKLFANLSGIEKANVIKEISDKLEIVSMTEHRFKKIKTFSKGMKTRIGLAQALLNDPVLLILDEPTDGLDPKGRLQIKNFLLGLKQKGKTILISSHVLSEIREFCDRLIVIHNGKLLNSEIINEALKLNRPEEFRPEDNISKTFKGKTLPDLEEMFFKLIDENS